MGGGLMQLVAYGAQDIYLTGNPQITFFKVVYRRHTNFSMEAIQQTFSGSGGQNPVCTISRNGDLVHKMYLVQTSTYAPGTRANQPITTVELEIGGQRIDRQSGQWMDTWNELSTPESKAIGLKSMTGLIGTTAADAVANVHIPLQFWFCRNPGLALPLIALQYHEVKVKFTLDTPAMGAFELFCDYIYLDTDERRRFAQVSHEYLIEQVQEQSAASDGKNKLNFNHPVKELIWSTSDGQATEVGLKLNGHDRFSSRVGDYFYLQQPFDYHTAVPRQNLPSAARSQILNQLSLAGTSESVVSASQESGGIAFSTTTFTGTSALSTSDLKKGDVLAIMFATVPAASGNHAIGGTLGGGALATTTVGTEIAGSIGEIYLTTVTADVAQESTTSISVTTPLINARTVTASETDVLQSITSIGDADDSDVTFKIHKLNNNIITEARTSKDSNPIGVYSFALKPEEHQPSGTCNFSRIDNAELTFTDKGQSGTIYAVNYNVLRIMSGMGGLAYSN
uniref:Major capsid protein N-terminal domain-containing protein n=1 Tax=viral metagenome TaxID=1070528 RepID=A0A6C0C545_9ZZZZ